MKEIYSRAHPLLTRIRERKEATGAGSSKKTYTLALSLEGASFPYKVGDSVGVLPVNRPEEVASLLDWFEALPEEPVFDKRAKEECPFAEFLAKRANLALGTRSLLELLAQRQGKDLAPLLEGQNRELLQAHLQNHSLLELLAPLPKRSISPQEWASLALPLLPRFYSIANAPDFTPGEIHLLVASSQYFIQGKLRIGVGSHFLGELAEVGKTAVPIYLQPSSHFTLPEDPEASLIMIGPGTGIAPFRAFLQQRLSKRAPGKNWLFFGERNRETDFYYAPFFLSLEQEGRLRLSLAFSRDQPEKIYVQHRMWEERKSLWQWIEEGAYLYVCGDAFAMAKDVEKTLHQIACEEGGKTEEEALRFFKELKAQKKYLLDVY